MPDFNGDSHEENRSKINRLRASSWCARSFSWLNSHPDEHHLKVLPLASSLCLWFPYPSFKRRIRTSPPALYLSDCHVRVTTGYLPTRTAESIPHLSSPIAPSLPRSAAPFSSKLLAHAHLQIPLTALSKPSEPPALSCLHNNWFFEAGTLAQLPTLSLCVSPIQSTAFAQQRSRAVAAPNKPLRLGTWKQQDNLNHPLCQQTYTDVWPVILESS